MNVFTAKRIGRSALCCMLTAAVFAACVPASASAEAPSAAEISSLDNTLCGYGQGREVNDENCPVGALMFNEQYYCYDAYALTDSPNICLTFDQGYENSYTAPILDTLKEKNVKAVFFVTGDYVKRNGELVQRMIDEGHIVGNHGMGHKSLPQLSEEEMETEIMSLHDHVSEKFGYEMKYFRPPCGEFSERALAKVQSLGYKTLVWSFAYCDWDVNDQPEAAAALERVSGAAHGGAVYLLHSVSATNCEILPQVIDNIRAAGYDFALPQL
ncbi:MAG: polysaccharide deacetylase family protein [Huintestinicola sp.]